MTNQGRRSLVVGNWKMYKTAGEAADFIDKLIPLLQPEDPSVYLAVPFTAIEASVKSAGTAVVIGAQNMNDATEGAFTGEVAADMLKEAGARFVILGHSERRRYFHEDDAFINRKVLRAIKENLELILCIGETEQQRNESKIEEVLLHQLTEGLKGVLPEQVNKVIIAYEPIWAIGSYNAATPEQAQEAHKMIRHLLSEIGFAEASPSTILLYGGSVSPHNIQGLMTQEDVDGVLVGGSSLSVDSFVQLVHYQQEVIS